MNDNDYFDAHCHIFTLRFALREARNILHDTLTGSYPWHAPSADDVRYLTMPDLSGIKELLRQFYELISASFGSEEENLDFLQKEALKGLPNNKWYIAPLMMDIFYLLAYSLDEGQSATQVRSLIIKSVDKENFQTSWCEILDDLEKHIKSKLSDKFAKDTMINNTLQVIEDERNVENTLSFKASLVGTTGFYQTEGFCFHLNKLVNLVSQRRRELYPFIAVDPRRPGIINTIINGQYINNDGPFYGIKLYPRMGYHPQSAPMDALYNYCNDKKIPITFHCGKSGFPPGTGWKYADFGNPVNFKPIVGQYPNLRINFAHLGSGDPNYVWAKTIINLMNQHDNVYSDLACYIDVNDLKAAKKFWDKNPKLKSRLMFGTDFDVMYFTGEIDMALYFANFKSIFSASELKLLMHDNPIKFLGL